MFESQNSHSSNSGILGPALYLVSAALCFGAGYGIATYRLTNADVQVTTVANANNAAITTTYISFRKSQPRVLENVNGKVRVGTLSQRLDDLLNEDPRRIRRLVRDSLDIAESTDSIRDNYRTPSNSSR